MTHKIISPTLVVMSLLLAAIFSTSCGDVKTNSGSSVSPSAQSSPAPSPKTGLEADLTYVRKGQYTYVWVFSRKDGKPLDGNDGAF